MRAMIPCALVVLTCVSCGIKPEERKDVLTILDAGIKELENDMISKETLIKWGFPSTIPSSDGTLADLRQNTAIHLVIIKNQAVIQGNAGAVINKTYLKMSERIIGKELKPGVKADAVLKMLPSRWKFIEKHRTGFFFKQLSSMTAGPSPKGSLEEIAAQMNQPMKNAIENLKTLKADIEKK